MTKIPKREKVVLTYMEDGKVKYILTVDCYVGNTYFRYDYIDGNLVKSKKKAKNPTELEDK